MAFCQLDYYSHFLGQHSSAWVILPNAEGPWPVLYLLHGRSDDHTIWCRRTSLERYVEKYPSLMIVMPNSGRSFSCDAVQGPAYQSSLIKDLIPTIDRTFRTRSERAGRAIGGLSMGGYGAIKLALQFPELFSSAHSHSGALDFGHGWRDEEPEAIALLGEHVTGGGPNDAYRVAIECKNPPALWLDCGTEDFLLDQNRSFHAHLEKSGVAHEYHEYPGGHGWDYWDLHIQDALAFHGRNLGLKQQV